MGGVSLVYNISYAIKLMPSDDPRKLFYKSINSYKGFIPSTDFDEYEYSLYLQYASAVELEKDILTEETYAEIMKTLIYEEVK